MSARARETSPRARDGTPSLSAGYLAALPLFLAYEIGLASLAGTAARTSAEQVVARLLSLFGGRLQWTRVALLAGLALLAYARLRRAGASGGRELAGGLARAVAEGVLAGILLGPVLVGLQAWLGAGPLPAAPEPARSLAFSLRLAGAAPWEELLFRVGLYGGVFVLVRRAGDFLGASRAAHFGAELAALLGSALLFAVFHLDRVQLLLGERGEPYHRGLFLWRLSAGILLGALFRWRGFGVAAWAHAVFNLGVALGIRA